VSLVPDPVKELLLCREDFVLGSKPRLYDEILTQ